jgi:hypothetical protein
LVTAAVAESDGLVDIACPAVGAAIESILLVNPPAGVFSVDMAGAAERVLNGMVGWMARLATGSTATWLKRPASEAADPASSGCGVAV